MAVTVDLGTGTASGFSAISGIENTVGGLGNDTLAGAAGINNTLTGGSGDDTFIVHDSGDRVVEAPNGGNDTVLSYANGFTLGANVETLRFIGSGNFIGTGNGGDNLIIGGGGADVLNGGGGNDTIEGGAGTDVMNGGAGNDTFVFKPNFGADVINGFAANPTSGQNLLDISGLGITAGNFAESVTITDLGADTLVEIGTGSILLLGVNGVGANAITQHDFLLA